MIGDLIGLWGFGFRGEMGTHGPMYGEGTGEPLEQAYLPSQASALRLREADGSLSWPPSSANSFSYGVRTARLCVELPGSEDARDLQQLSHSPEPSNMATMLTVPQTPFPGR